jgi:four helix bundle protein
MKDFKKLIVWQKGMDLFIELHAFVRKLPPEEKYELSSQLKRATFSIPANIAEGSAKATPVHYKLFLEHALGSAYESETGLLAITQLYPILAPEAKILLFKVVEIQKMLISFINKLKSSQPNL